MFASTFVSTGFVLIWGDVAYIEKLKIVKRNNNRKRFVKAVKLQKNQLTCIVNDNELEIKTMFSSFLKLARILRNFCCFRIIVIGNNVGELHFYDYQLKLLYLCKDCGIDSIASISFDCQSDLLGPDLSMSETTVSKVCEELDDIFESEDEEGNGDESGIETYNGTKISDTDTETEMQDDLKLGNVESRSEVGEEVQTDKRDKICTPSALTIDIEYLNKRRGMTRGLRTLDKISFWSLGSLKNFLLQNSILLKLLKSKAYIRKIIIFYLCFHLYGYYCLINILTPFFPFLPFSIFPFLSARGPTDSWNYNDLKHQKIMKIW